MIELLPVPPAVAAAVCAYGDLDAVLERPHAVDWPHDDTADALRPLAEHPEDTGEGTFLVVHDGEVVGDCGWFGPPQDGVVEIGYGLAPSARGRGIGTAAVDLLLTWVTSRGATRVRAEVLPGNEPSLRLLARLGFEDVGAHAGHRVLERPLL
ncbi:MAG: GNAT family protein [Mycobacteriales bacterium]